VGHNAPVSSQPRLRILDSDEARAAAETAGVDASVTVLNLNRVLFHHPGMGRRFVQYFTELMFKHRVDPRLRELAILRIAWVTGSVYEWTQHWHVAVGLGLSPDDLLGVRDPDSHPGYDDLDRAVLAAVDDVVVAGSVSPPTWERLAAHLDEAQLVEVVMFVCGWRMVASILLSLEVPLEDGTEPWPPDGVVPDTAAGEPVR